MTPTTPEPRMSRTDTLESRLTHVLCPHIKMWADQNPDVRAACKHCPETVQTDFGPAQQACYSMANDAARAAIALVVEEAAKVQCDMCQRGVPLDEGNWHEYDRDSPTGPARFPCRAEAIRALARP